MKLGLEDNPPAPGTTRIVVEGTADLRAQRRTRVRVPQGRPRVRVEHAVDDLGDPMGGGIEHVLVGRPPALGRVAPQGRGDYFAHVDSAAILSPRYGQSILLDRRPGHHLLVRDLRLLVRSHAFSHHPCRPPRTLILQTPGQNRRRRGS